MDPAFYHSGPLNQTQLEHTHTESENTEIKMSGPYSSSAENLLQMRKAWIPSAQKKTIPQLSPEATTVTSRWMCM